MSLTKTINSLTLDSEYLVSDLSNISSYLYHELGNVNWVGFYIVKDNVLHLGPFVGKPACIRIKNGKGVCGTCLKEKKTIYVPNVHEFPGHIACDSESNSELVVPIIEDDNVIAILDIDSTLLNRFNQEEIDEISKTSSSIAKLFSTKKNLV